jgi:hypothetical protein
LELRRFTVVLEGHDCGIVTMSMDASPTDGRPRQPRTNDTDPAACERCAGPVELLTALPRRIDHSAYRIFACTACNFVQWIPE